MNRLNEEWLYVMFIEKGKSYNRLNKAMIAKHVEHIRKLDDSGRLVLSGPFKGYPGIAGMVILKARSYEEAEEICKLEPLVAEGYATYRLITLQVANRDNDYLL